MTSPFTKAGYTDKTVFKVLDTYGTLEEGELVIIIGDDKSTYPPVKNKYGCWAGMYLPSSAVSELEVVALDGVKEGILDKDGNLLFSTYDEWVESKGEAKENVTQENTTPQYEIGEIVKIVDNTCSHYFEIGENVRITQLDHEGGSAEYLDKHDWWAFRFEDIEKLPVETKEKEVKSDVLETNKTPYQQKGWTRDSVFRYGGESGANQFEKGDEIVLDIDTEDNQILFKPLNNYEKHCKTYSKGRWVFLHDLTYLGEYGNYMKGNVVNDTFDSTVNPKTLRTPQDYRELSPDTMIKIVVDGHEGEVPLADLVILKFLLGRCNGTYLSSTYDLLKHFNSCFNGELVKDCWDCNNVSSYQDELIAKFFTANKRKEFQTKLVEKQKERESLDNEIQALQSELENL